MGDFGKRFTQSNTGVGCYITVPVTPKAKEIHRRADTKVPYELDKSELPVTVHVGRLHFEGINVFETLLDLGDCLVVDIDCVRVLGK